jgi:hypothetical protein
MLLLYNESNYSKMSQIVLDGAVSLTMRGMMIHSLFVVTQNVPPIDIPSFLPSLMHKPTTNNRVITSSRSTRSIQWPDPETLDRVVLLSSSLANK